MIYYLFTWIALTWDHNKLSDLYANLSKANLSLPCLTLQHFQKFCSDVDNRQSNKDSKIDGDSSGIWYAGIVVFGKEYAFSQAGVESTLPVSIRLLSD